MPEETQFDLFSAQQANEEEVISEVSVEVAEPPDVPEQNQPALFEDLAPAQKETKPEIPWTEYTRMVQMFFTGPQYEDFKGQISKLAADYGTKNLTDTVAEAIRRAAN